MKYTNFIKYLLASIPLLSFWGCESEDLPNSGQGELVPVTIRLNTEGSGLATRAGNTADIIENDDAITSLDVYIMNGTTVEKHLQWEDFSNNISGEFEIPTGNKQIYAIANYPGLQGNPPANQAVNAFAQISTTIPMSADTTWNISSSGTYTVELIRMVAKMMVSIVNDEEDNTSTNSTPSISKFKIEKLLPAQTMLYRNSRNGSSLPNITLPEDVKMNNWTWENLTIGETGTEFYLHETEGTFTVSLYDGEKNRSNTFSTEIPRNYILPLIIHLSDYRLDFTGSTYQHGPIGVIKDPIPINNYTIALPSGASAVTIKIGLKEAGGTVDNTINWDYNIAQDGDLPALGVTPSTDNGILTVLNNYNFPAGLTGTITLNLSTTVNDGGTNKDLKFTVTINVKKIEEVDTRSASNEAEPIIVEL